MTFVAAVLISGGVFYGLVVLLDFQDLDTTAKLDAKTLFDLLKLSFGVVAGAGALVALVVAYRRQRVDEAGAHREATRLHTERFSQAVDKLGSDSPAVRLGGVHALAGLADDAPDSSLRQTCIDVLCAYLRLPYTPDPGEDPAYLEERNHYIALREVRHTILRLIGDHYRRPEGTHRSWQGCDLDLTGVTIDGRMDFSGSTFSRGTVSFTGAMFSNATVDFFGAEFSGSTLSFSGSTFSGGRVNFGSAGFSSGDVSFYKAVFSGCSVSFDKAAFSGSTVFFGQATFSGGLVSFLQSAFSQNRVSFARATFSSGRVYFGDAAFSGGEVDFGRAAFSGGEVDFDRAAFSGGMVSFTNAEFSGSHTDFRRAMFSGSTVSFGQTAFSGGEVDFYDATFSGGLVTFAGSTFSTGVVSFGSSTFSGGQMYFGDATGSAPNGLLAAIGSPVPTTVTLAQTWIPNP
ncbi:pentapeptide repeat-containing protein [Streptomyces sp. CRB46]|uniref:pentapeptide repeat-containing protein n=1 Tax=Streptomyces sp. CRB46 TaxID=2682613 RepID=UPI0027DADEA2|nr:pentapeptide repeat-containing protein [Streptomyces sp. CRB46]